MGYVKIRLGARVLSIDFFSFDALRLGIVQGVREGGTGTRNLYYLDTLWRLGLPAPEAIEDEVCIENRRVPDVTTGKAEEVK